MFVGGQRHAPAALPPGKDPVPIVYEAEWTPEPVWTGVENVVPTGIRSPNRPARVPIPTELSRPIWNPKVHYPPTFVNNLSQTHLVPALPSTARSSTLSLPFKFRHPNPVYEYIFLSHMCATCLTHLILLHLIIRKVFG